MKFTAKLIKMAVNKKGVFTHSTLLQFNTESVDLEVVFKRASIFFDQIILSELIPIEYKFSKFIANNFTDSLIPIVKKKLDAKFSISNSFDEIFYSDEEYDEMFNTIKAQNKTHSPLMSDEYLSDFINCVTNFPTHEPDDLARQFEVGLNLDNIYNDHILYSNLSIQLPDYSGILSPKMGIVLDTVLNKKQVSQEKIVELISKVSLFDFGQLSWDNILELRRSKFADDFRKKIVELFQEYQNIQDTNEISIKLDEFVKEANFKFIEEKYPNPIRTFASGVTGTLFAPFSVISTIHDTIKDISTKKKYDWLYFIIESKKKSQT